MNLKLVTAPAAEPVTATEAKTHCRITGTDQDSVITILISAAREMAEAITRRALITQTWDMYLDRFERVIDVPLPPLQSVTSVTYTDTAGDSQTAASSLYDVDLAGNRIILKDDQVWPDTLIHENSVIVRFVAGYGAAGTAIPQPIKQAILMLIGHFYENREVSAPIQITQVPMAADWLLSPYRWVTF